MKVPLFIRIVQIRVDFAIGSGRFGLVYFCRDLLVECVNIFLKGVLGRFGGGSQSGTVGLAGPDKVKVVEVRQ